MSTDEGVEWYTADPRQLVIAHQTRHTQRRDSETGKKGLVYVAFALANLSIYTVHVQYPES